MIRTTYFGGLGSLVEPADEDDVLGVVRYPRDFVSRITDRNIPALAPPANLLNAFKAVEKAADEDGVPNPSAIAWETVNFERRYRAFLERTGQQRVLDELRERVRARHDIWLVCWEKDVRYCHRRVLADVLTAEVAVEVVHHPALGTTATTANESDQQDRPRNASLDAFGGEMV